MQAGAVHFVLGGRSEVVPPEERAWLEGLAARGGAVEGPRVAVHVIEGAGHWVHTDAPDALDALLARELP